MSNAMRDIEELVDIATDQGFRVQPHRNKSFGYVVYGKDGHGIVTLRRSGDSRAIMNAKSDLRKIGVEFDRPIKKQKDEPMKKETADFTAMLVPTNDCAPAVPLSPLKVAMNKLQAAVDALCELETALKLVEQDTAKMEAVRAALRGLV